MRVFFNFLNLWYWRNWMTIKDPKQLIREEETWVAFRAYLSAQQKILNKKPDSDNLDHKIQRLNQCWENLSSTRKELDHAWAKSVRS